MWIALKFFVLLQSKQLNMLLTSISGRCELLSNFLYFCSRNNEVLHLLFPIYGVNCSQIFCTFAVETTASLRCFAQMSVWIALKFFVLLQSKQQTVNNRFLQDGCELLSNFLYFCSRNNHRGGVLMRNAGVNCSQIFCTFAVETTYDDKHVPDVGVWIALKFFVLLQSKQRIENRNNAIIRCELLSNFLYFCSRNNRLRLYLWNITGVNCSQIFCTFAVETTSGVIPRNTYLVWIALKFFVLLQSKQHYLNEILQSWGVNCSQIFCTFAVETT